MLWPSGRPKRVFTFTTTGSCLAATTMHKLRQALSLLTTFEASDLCQLKAYGTLRVTKHPSGQPASRSVYLHKPTFRPSWLPVNILRTSSAVPAVSVKMFTIQHCQLSKAVTYETCQRRLPSPHLQRHVL